jgi:hypothetical protein
MFGKLHLAGLWVKEPPEWKGDTQIGQGCDQRNPSSRRFRRERQHDSSRKGNREEQ